MRSFHQAVQGVAYRANHEVRVVQMNVMAGLLGDQVRAARRQRGQLVLHLQPGRVPVRRQGDACSPARAANNAQPPSISYPSQPPQEGWLVSGVRCQNTVTHSRVQRDGGRTKV
jgi:hypothetical protein